MALHRLCLMAILLITVLVLTNGKINWSSVYEAIINKNITGLTHLKKHKFLSSWTFDTGSLIHMSGGDAPNITFDDIPSDDDVNKTSTTINTSGATETSTTPQTSGTTKTPATPMCSCACEDVTQQPPTEEELEILKDNLKKELAVDKKKLSKTIRAKTSAPDERQSAQGIGTYKIFLNINITGLKHVQKVKRLSECVSACGNTRDCTCLYYQQSNSSCSFFDSYDCNRILNSKLPETNDTTTVLMVRQDGKGKIKRSSDYQKINSSVKHPNITFHDWFCENLCSWSLNCCGYSYQYGRWFGTYKIFLNKNITGLKHVQKVKRLSECVSACGNTRDCTCLYYQQFNSSCSFFDSYDCDRILNSKLPETNDTTTVLMVRQDGKGKIKRSSEYQKINSSVKHPNITFHDWNQWFCENLCSWSLNCCGYSHNFFDSYDCDRILNSKLPETNDTTTVLMVRQDGKGKIKRSSEYQKINSSVKHPNITFGDLNQWFCENLCSWSLNCCGYSHKYGRCQLLVMNYCYKSTKVLLSDGSFIDLSTPIKWLFAVPDNGVTSSGDLPGTKEIISTNSVTEIHTKPQTSSTRGTSDKIKTTAITPASLVTSTAPMCSCACEHATQQPPTKKELEILKDNLKKELAVDKKKLSKTIRAKTSAPDERRSAQEPDKPRKILSCICLPEK
ncbi:Hypothetical predicted protein [Octopus vulgaris]|uniref:Uncharacterized protein n=1 Tax=Octopus vulgaris TaxID=6645 RepID=A0AA36FFK3_OCTVU|nr:Hypothetical predicted protein [Octopus vulgaris]